MSARYYLLCVFVFCVGVVLGSVTKKSELKLPEQYQNTDSIIINSPSTQNTKVRITTRLKHIPRSQIRKNEIMDLPDQHVWVIELNGQKYFAEYVN